MLLLQNTLNFRTNDSFNHTIFQVSTEIQVVPTLCYYLPTVTLATFALPDLKISPLDILRISDGHNYFYKPTPITF